MATVHRSAVHAAATKVKKMAERIRKVAEENLRSFVQFRKPNPGIG
jgi:hypothetical protein